MHVTNKVKKKCILSRSICEVKILVYPHKCFFSSIENKQLFCQKCIVICRVGNSILTALAIFRFAEVHQLTNVQCVLAQ